MAAPNKSSKCVVVLCSGRSKSPTILMPPFALSRTPDCLFFYIVFPLRGSGFVYIYIWNMRPFVFGRLTFVYQMSETYLLITSIRFSYAECALLAPWRSTQTPLLDTWSPSPRRTASFWSVAWLKMHIRLQSVASIRPYSNTSATPTNRFNALSH